MRNTGEGAKPPLRYSLNLSAHFRVWVTVWVRQLTHILTHTFFSIFATKSIENRSFRCFFGAAGQIRTADLILTKKFAFILPCVRLCLYIPSGLCAIRLFVLSSLSSFYLILGRLLEDLLEILFRILHQNRIPYGVLLQSRPTHLPNTHTSVK